MENITTTTMLLLLLLPQALAEVRSSAEAAACCTFPFLFAFIGGRYLFWGHVVSYFCKFTLKQLVWGGPSAFQGHPEAQKNKANKMQSGRDCCKGNVAVLLLAFD